MGCFLSGPNQETMIGAIVSCDISETRSIKRDWIHVWSSQRAYHGEVEWTQKGRVAQRGIPDVK